MSFELLIINELNQLDMHPTALTIKPIVALWNNDKSKDKKQALQELAFIYWMYNWNSLYYKGYPDESERFGMVVAEVSHPELAHLQTARNTLDKLKKFLDTMEPGETTKSGGLVLKPAEIYAAVSKMGDALIAVEKMEDKIKKEIQLEESEVRGGGRAGAFEDETNVDYLKK